MNGAGCPRCGQNAPLVYRGINAYCTACGAPRIPLTSTSLNLAGQPSKVGGTVARAFGWIVLALGMLVGSGTFAACGAVVGYAEAAPYLLSLPLVAISSFVAWLLLRSGNDLQRAGDQAEKTTRRQAIFALANTRGGVLTAMDVARYLHVTPKEGDDVLTELAKEGPDHVTVDVDDSGTVLFRFPSIHWGTIPNPAAAGPSPVRVAPPEAGVRVDARDPLDDEDEIAVPHAAQRQGR